MTAPEAGRGAGSSIEGAVVLTPGAPACKPSRRQKVPCRRCGGPKEAGVQGSKYCAACREIAADVSAQLARERRLHVARQDRARKVEEAIARGEKVSHRRVAPDGQKWCARCQRFLPFSSFPPRAKGTKKAAYCVPCAREYQHTQRLKTVFGMSAEQYHALLEQQDGRCAICMTKPRTRRLAVDHNHATGEIRGLLCSRCNKDVLGAGNESPSLLRRAAAYLERPPARTGEGLDSLGEARDQENDRFLEESNHLNHGEVALHRSGELMSVTFKTAVALAQAAGLSLVVDGERFSPHPQMAIDDLDLVKRAWESLRDAGLNAPYEDGAA